MAESIRFFQKKKEMQQAWKAAYPLREKRDKSWMLSARFCYLHGHTKAKCVFIVFAFRTAAAFSTVLGTLLQRRERDAGAAAEGGAVMVQHALLAHHPWGWGSTDEKDLRRAQRPSGLGYQSTADIHHEKTKKMSCNRPRLLEDPITQINKQENNSWPQKRWNRSGEFLCEVFLSVTCHNTLN